MARKKQSPHEAAIVLGVVIVRRGGRGSRRELVQLHEAGDIPFFGDLECGHPGLFNAIELTEALVA
jgi:hypothetical protein